jgi:hypothetical protein
MFRGRVQEYWLPTPFAFTSPPVLHCVPSHFKRALQQYILVSYTKSLHWKGFSIQCYSSPSTSRKEWPNADSFVSCLKLKYLGHYMVVSWSLCHMLGYINWCKILQFLMSFTRKALHPKKQECSVIYHEYAKMTQLALKYVGGLKSFRPRP